MKRIVLEISGEARGKARTRPRPGATGDASRFMKPKADRIAEAVIVDRWEDAGKPRIEDDVALRMLIVAIFPRPKSHFNSKGELNATGRRHPHPRNKKPDLDNIAKLACDALNKRAYKDDVMFSEMGIIRRWGDWARTLIVIDTVHDPVE